MRNIICYILFLSALVNVKAQLVERPCARILSGSGQDSITWSATICSNFDGFIIFASSDTNSALVPIDTITNPAQLGFLASNPQETPRFYRISILCGNAISTSTFIVRNTKPITPNIRSVNIINNRPVLNWYASPSPEVTGYKIYKEDPYGSGNFFPYPNNSTIINGLSFTDVSSSSLLVRYAIVAVSDCNEGLLGEGNPLDGTTGPHTSMSLSYNLNRCSRQIRINWNRYENWEDGVDFYTLYVSRNGILIQTIDSIFNNAYNYNAAQANELLQFWVEAKEKNSNNIAVSNRQEVLVDISNPMEYVYFTGATIDANTQKPFLSWRWDADADIQFAEIQRRTDSILPWQTVATLNTISSTVQNYLDTTADASADRYYYQILVTDSCGVKSSSNVVGTILLEGTSIYGIRNRLFWNPFYFQYGTTTNFQIWQIDADTNVTQTGTASNTEFIYEDVLNEQNEADRYSCYYITAEATLSLPGEPLRVLRSRSNTICVEKSAVLWFPNALYPDANNAVNRKFRPLVAFGTNLKAYELYVYDRYGSLVFTSTDVYEGWDGTLKNELLPAGVYVFICKYIGTNDKTVEEKGTVTLIR